MKNKPKLFGIYLPIFLIIVPTTVVLRTIACLKDYHGWYFSDKLLITISIAILAAGIAFFLTYIWTARKDIKFIPSFSSPAHYITGGVVSVSLVFVAIELFSITKSRFQYLDKGVSNYAYQLAMAIFTLAAAVLALAATFYFISSSINPKRRSVRHSDLAIITTVFFCIYVAIVYFDTSIPINSPIRITDQIALLSTTLFFLYEARLSLGREKWRHYIAYGMIASSLTAYASIPSIIYYFVKGETLADSETLGNLCLYDSVLLFAIFLFITAKLFLTRKLIPDKTSALVERIVESADARAEELAVANEAKESSEDVLNTEVAFNDDNTTEKDLTEESDDTMQESFFGDEPITDDITKEDEK